MLNSLSEVPLGGIQTAVIMLNKFAALWDFKLWSRAAALQGIMHIQSPRGSIYQMDE